MRIKRIKQKKRVRFDLKAGDSKFVINTEPEDPKLPGLFVFCGSRGSGKTYACVAMVAHFERMGYITRTFLICPTKQSNDIFNNLKTLDQTKDVCDKPECNKTALANIMNEVKKDWAKYEDDKLYMKTYKKYSKKPGLFVPVDAEKILASRDFSTPVQPKKPAHMVIADDLQGTNMYSNARNDLMAHVAIKSRHIPISVAYLVQSWNGLPRVIRLNATQFMVYKTGDKKQLKQIYEHFGTTLDEPTFNRLYTYAVAQPHGFLYIDTEPKKESMRFRSGFNEFLDPTESTDALLGSL